MSVADWQMSLRDAWTRYVTLGGPLSAIEMPFVGSLPPPLAPSSSLALPGLELPQPHSKK